MGYKLLASDLDGTFLDSNSAITKGNREAIHRAMDAGVFFALCSGRSHMSLTLFEQELGINKKGNYGISYNGCIVYETDTHKILHECPLKKASALRLLGELKQYGVDTVVYTRDALYARGRTATIDEYRSRSRIPLNICADFGDLNENIEKVLLIGEYNKTPEAKEKLARAYEGVKDFTEGLCNMFYSASNLLEFTDPAAHKGAGLAFLADYLGVAQAETVAAGDNFNDVTMLEWAGLGVAVRNAKPEVQALADYVTRGTNDEDAIKEIIDDFILKSGE